MRNYVIRSDIDFSWKRPALMQMAHAPLALCARLPSSCFFSRTVPFFYHSLVMLLSSVCFYVLHCSYLVHLLLIFSTWHRIVLIITFSGGISIASHLLLSVYNRSFFLSQSQLCSSGASYPRWLLESSQSVAYREKEAAVHLPARGIHSAELFVKQQITWLQLLSGTAVNSVLRVRNMI